MLPNIETVETIYKQGEKNHLYLFHFKKKLLKF